MTGSLRSTARNPVAVAIMGLLMLVFLLLGVGGGSRMQDILRTGNADAVVAAGAHQMSTRDYRRIFEGEQQRFEQQAGQQVSVSDLISQGFDQQLLAAIADDEAEMEMLTRAGVRPAPQLVDAEIKKLPWAFDKVTGRFSEQQFTQSLAEQGLTPRQAAAQLTDDLAEKHFAAALEAGFHAPRMYAALAAIAGLELRDIRYFILDPKTVPQPPTPTDAQLQAFIKEHAAQLTRPEMRTIDLVRFSAAAIEPTITVAPADVEKAFAAEKDKLTTPETRTVIEIPVKDAASGAQAAARLAKGEDPAAIARSLGVQPIAYDDKPLAAIADRKVGQAAFAMKAGQVQGPIAGDLGLAVVKVAKVTPGKAADLESARPQIEAELKHKAAQDKAYELSQKFDDARTGGASLAEAAAKAGAPVTSVGPFTDKGVGADGKPTGLPDKIVKSAFTQAAGEEGDIEDAGPGEYFAVKVAKVQPPAPPPLAEFRPQLAKAWTEEQFVNALKAKADGLMARLRKGESMDTVAASVGAHVTRQAGMQRIAAQQYKALGGDFLQGVFSAKPGDVFAAPSPQGQVFVARLDAVRPGDTTQMARAVQAIEPRVSQQYGQDLMAAVKSAARRKLKASINLALARQAVGYEPTPGTGPKSRRIGASGRAQ